MCTLSSMPLYPMKPRLSDKEKIKFLRKRYNDAFDLLENAYAWLKKNSGLNQQKLQFLKSIRQQRLSGFSTAKNAEKEKKLSVATREYSRMGKRFMELISFVENDEKAIKRLGGRLQKRVLGGVSVAKSNSSSFGRPRESHESQVEMRNQTQVHLDDRERVMSPKSKYGSKSTTLRRRVPSGHFRTKNCSQTRTE